MEDLVEPVDEQRLFAAAWSTFNGRWANTRSLEEIADIIDADANDGVANDDLSELLEKQGDASICAAILVLLEEGVFESAVKAKSRFPSLFAVAPSTDAEIRQSTLSAFEREDVAIGAAAIGKPDEINGQAGVNRPHSPSRDSLKQDPTRLLQAPHLPLSIQHHYLAKVKAVLEMACFQFARRNHPRLLAERGWDCSEAVELHLWAKTFKENPDLFQNGNIVQSQVLRSMEEIRYVVVDRVQICDLRLERYMKDSENLTNVLEGHYRPLWQLQQFPSAVANLRRDLQATIKEITESKHLVVSTCQEKLARIAAQRAELDLQEDAAIDAMLADKNEFQNFVGRDLLSRMEIHSRHL